MTLRSCSQCRRHFADEPACPFCGAAAPPRSPREFSTARLSRAAAFAGAALTGCWANNPPPHAPTSPVHESREQTHTEQQTFAEPPPPVAKSRIEGVVTDSVTGAPRANVVVQLGSQNPPAPQSTATVSTDASGRYMFDNLEPGDYVVTFRQRNPRRAPQQVMVKLGSNDTQTANGTYTDYTPSNIPLPYGAPPARQRIV